MQGWKYNASQNILNFLEKQRFSADKEKEICSGESLES